MNIYKTPINGALREHNILFSRTGEQTNRTTWLQARINVTDITESFRLAIEAVRGNDYRGDIAIDDINTTRLGRRLLYRMHSTEMN